MFTVIVGFEGSGKSRTLKPFARRYSVMPSTDVTFVTPAGSAEAAEGGAARAFGVAAGLASCAAAKRGRKAAVRSATRVRMDGDRGKRAPIMADRPGRKEFSSLTASPCKISSSGTKNQMRQLAFRWTGIFAAALLAAALAPGASAQV